MLLKHSLKDPFLAQLFMSCLDDLAKQIALLDAATPFFKKFSEEGD